MAAATTNTTKLLVSILLSLLVSASIAESESRSRRREEAGQCRINRLSATRPSRRIDSQGGTTELWDDNDDEFQCAGVAAMRNTIRPNSLSLPNYQSAPSLFYVERGRGLVGISYPGCAETYQSEEAWGGREGGQREEGTPERRDQHQKVHQVSQGDLILVPAGTTHYCINDGTEDLVVVSITDLENDANQLDNSRFRAFFLAGGIPRGSQHQTTEEERSQRRRERFQNVLRGLDEELLAEAFNIPVEVARKMQREDNRGFIVKLRDGWSLASPSQRYEERGSSVSAGTTANHQNPSSLEGSICSAKIFQNLDNPRDALFYGKNAGRLNAANRQTLPILGIARLSAEKLRLLPDALLSPHYTMYGHTVVYVTRGEARVQVVGGTDGRALLDQTVRQGEMFVIPQFAVATAKAGRSGFESVSFKTTGESAASPLAGSASVMRGLPLPVIANAYGISGEEAEDLKQNRRREMLLLSPTRRRPSSP